VAGVVIGLPEVFSVDALVEFFPSMMREKWWSRWCAGAPDRPRLFREKARPHFHDHWCRRIRISILATSV